MMKGRIYIRVARRDLALASVRYRGLLPGCALQDLGWNVAVGSGKALPPDDAAFVIAVKPLLEGDAAWIREVAGRGTPVIADLCDNVFIDGYANQGEDIGRRFAALAGAFAAVMVPTAALRDIVIERTRLEPGRVFVVPDIVESRRLLDRQRKLLGQSLRAKEMMMRFAPVARRWLVRRPPMLLWFGNHGASYANFGMDDLRLFEDALRLASERFGAELCVVSNNRERFEKLAARLPIASRYVEWTPTRVDRLLSSASVCLVPNSLDSFSATKSANRAVRALSAGVPVVATRTTAYAGLEGAMWLDDPADGIATYLGDRALRDAHLAEAKRVLERQYSIVALGEALQAVLREAASFRDAA